ncbi:hypothetical protein FOA43_000162 [Brettanomyces nanus]|uniref:Uncharacterized protein n=1 Tax=Eeniella nana TaxID=13502 RepID=A0A875RMX8_EENNA|nr:uncharacterized protein FOA43_000162 [Brettanomyces nanus]QPG72860.1 hypothetical protein FOA43_000162 [Brettanomyces nanus]
MRLQSLLICAFLTGISLAETFSHVVKSLGSNGPVKVTDNNYQEVMANEDYSLVLFITASSPRIGCVLCTEVMPKYSQLASSYYKNLRASGVLNVKDDGLKNEDLELNKSKFVIAYADLSDAPEFFKILGINSVPKVYYYDPRKAMDAANPTDQYRFAGDDIPQRMSGWIMSHSSKSDPELFHIIETPDYQSMMANVFAFLVALFVLYKKSDRLMQVVFNKKLWRACCMILVILLCSGYMYNRIRQTEFTGHTQEGLPVYFAPSQQSQYAAETQIVSVIYAFAAVGVIVIADTVNRAVNPKHRFSIIVVCLVVVYFAYAYLMACFKAKNQGYPFSLMSVF